MGDMPCVWCLLFVQARPYGGQITVFGYNPARPDVDAVPVSNWAEAEEMVYGSGYVLRDHNGDRCNLDAKTLVAGDAVCLTHATSILRARSVA